MIPKDKLLHAVAGLAVALAALALYLLAVHANLAPLGGAPVTVALCALVAGITKEGADYLDNRVRPGSHGVEFLDVVATAAPGFMLAAAVQQVLLTP